MTSKMLINNLFSDKKIIKSKDNAPRTKLFQKPPGRV